MRCLLCLLFSAGVLHSQAADVRKVHTFTSADGSKIIEAAIAGYQPSKQTATIVMNGRKMVVPVTAFNVEDKAKFDDWYQANEAGRQLRLNFEDTQTEGSEKKLTNATISNYDSGFAISVRNNGQTEFENVTLQYRIFYYQDMDKGGKVSAHKDGELKIGKITPRETKNLSTEKVALTRQRPKQ